MKTSKVILTGSLVAGAIMAFNASEVKAENLLSYNDLGSAGEVRSVLLNDFSNASAYTGAIELKCGETKKAADGKCGEKKAETKDTKKAKDGKCGEGKCGEKKAKDGKCGEKKAKDGKCGEKKADTPKN